MRVMWAIFLGTIPLLQAVEVLKPPVPVGKETSMLVAYLLNCETDEYIDLKDNELSEELAMIASEECQGDPFTDNTHSMQVFCRPKDVLELRSYDNINCRGDPNRVTSFTNGFCHDSFTTGGFVINWDPEDWKAICKPPCVEEDEDSCGETKGDWCRKQGMKDGRKDCLRWECCSWTDNQECVANAKTCSDRKKVNSCRCPDDSEGVAVNIMADINDDAKDGCACPKTSHRTCARIEDEEHKVVRECNEEPCFTGARLNQGKGPLDKESVSLCRASLDDLEAGECCVNSYCVKCDEDKPNIKQCTDPEPRGAIQAMLIGENLPSQLDLIGCAMALLGQRTDPRMSISLCNCYVHFEREKWEDNMCWLNDRETLNTIDQYDNCMDYLQITLCSSIKKQSKCRRRHQCVWNVDKGKQTKSCIPAVRAQDVCKGIPKRSKCDKATECVWRKNEGCISNGRFSCEGLSRSHCNKQCGCFFQNPYGCRKNRHRHNRYDKLNEDGCEQGR